MIKTCCLIINFCVAALPVQPDHVTAPVLWPALRVVRVSLHDHLHQTHELHHIQTHQHRLGPEEGDGLKMIGFSGLDLSVAGVQEEKQSDDGRGDDEPDHNHG